MYKELQTITQRMFVTGTHQGIMTIEICEGQQIGLFNKEPEAESIVPQVSIESRHDG